MADQLFEYSPRPIDQLITPSDKYLDVLVVGVSPSQRRYVDAGIEDLSLSIDYVEAPTDQAEQTREQIVQVLRGRTPRRILCFGGHASIAVCGHSFNALRCRNAWELDARGTPIFHFPYVFNIRENRIIRGWATDDVRWAMSEVPQYTLPEYTYHVVSSVTEAEQALSLLDGHPYEIDTETFGPQHHPGHTIFLAALCKVGDRQVWVFDLDQHPETLAPLQAFLQRNPELFCAHNGKHDVSAIEEDWGVRLGPVCHADTYIGARLRQGDGDAGLDIVGGLVGLCGHKNEFEEQLSAVCKVVGILRRDRDKEIILATEKVTKLNKNGKNYSRNVVTQSRPPTVDEQRQQIQEAWTKERTFNKESVTFEQLYGELTERWMIAALSDYEPEAYAYALVNRPLTQRYCAMDVAVGATLVPVLQPAVEQSEGVWRDSLRYAPCAVARMEQTGLLMDLQRRQELEDYLDQEIQQKASEIASYLPGVNLNSDDELAHGLYDTLKLKCHKMTSGGKSGVKKRSVDKYCMLKLKDAHPVIPLIAEYSSLNTYQSNYARGLIPHITPYSRVHTTFKIMGTDSGRMSSNKPNLQVLPSRDKKSKLIKRMFIAPENYVVVEIDYGQLELRMMAMLSQDPVLLDFIKRGVDLHREGAAANAKEIWGVDWESLKPEEQKPLRDKFKEILFGCVSMDTRILTRTGWKSYDEVQVGDYTLGKSGWVRILEKVQYPVAPVVEWEGFKVTPNHRWWGRRRRHLNDGTRPYVNEFMSLDSMTGDREIILAVPQDVNTTCGLTPDECALVGWILTDGSCPRGQESCVFVYQSETKNEQKVYELRALFNRLKLTVSEYTANDYGGLAFRIKDPCQVWRKRCEAVDEMFVTRMSARERAAFVRAGLRAEGHKRGAHWDFTQKDGSVADAFRLAFFLEGHHVTQSRTYGSGAYENHWCWRMHLGKPRVTGQKLRFEELPKTTEPVWCVRTEDETWTMRRGHAIGLTGNTAYGQSAKGLAERFNMTEAQAEKVQRYIMGRYKVLAKFIQENGKLIAQMGEIWTWWDGKKGRRRPLADVGSSDHGLVGHGDRAGKNTVIQGTGHEFLLASIGAVQRWLDKDEVDAKIMLAVHDALYALVHVDSLEEYIRGVCKIMLGWNSLGTPLTVEVKTGKSMGEMETYDHTPLLAS